MRILFAAHNFVFGNGQGRINFEIVRHALAAGHAVTLVADQVADELVAEGARTVRVRQLPRRPNLLGVRSFVSAADREVEKLRSGHDVVVAGGYTLRRPHDVNICQFVHGAWLKSPVHVAKLTRGAYSAYQWTFSRLNARWEQQTYRAAAKVVAPSVKIQEELRSIGVPDDRIEVIHNGVDLDEFKPASTNRNRTSLGLPADGLIGLFVGDIRTTRKNLDTVLRAMVHLPGIHLCVVGELAGSPFPKMAAALNIADRTHFVGYRRDVKDFMQVCDVFLFPSRYEAGTLVLLEAAASGLPLITARTAGGCEVFGPEAAQILEDPNDVEALVRAVRHMTDSPLRIADAGRAARTAAECHSWSRMAERYLQLFIAASGDKLRSRSNALVGQVG